MLDIELSLGVEQRLRSIAELQNIGNNAASRRCIGLAHYIMKSWQSRCQFFMENEPLKIPPPRQINDPTFSHVRLRMYDAHHQELQELCDTYGFDKHSALAWGLACVELFENTILTHRIFASGPGKKVEIELKWLK